MFTKDEAWKLAEALSGHAWGFVTIQINGEAQEGEANVVIWNIREGLGLSQRHVEIALALAQLHGCQIHIGWNAGSHEIRFEKRS